MEGLVFHRALVVRHVSHHLIFPGPTHGIVVFLAEFLSPGSVALFLAGLLCNTFLSITIAAVTFVCVEQPVLTLRDRWLQHGNVAHTLS